MAHHCRSAGGWCESRTRQGLPPQQSQQDCAFAARPTIHASVFNTGHTGQTSINPSWERFPCGVRGVGRIRTSGGLRPCCFRDSRIRPLCHYSTDPHEGTNWLTYSCGSRAPGGIRTHDHKVRTLLLWSAELRERGGCPLRFKKSDNPFPKEVIRFFLEYCCCPGIHVFRLLFARGLRIPPYFAMSRLHMALCHASCSRQASNLRRTPFRGVPLPVGLREPGRLFPTTVDLRDQYHLEHPEREGKNGTVSFGLTNP